jgi:hypothetical protein
MASTKPSQTYWDLFNLIRKNRDEKNAQPVDAEIFKLWDKLFERLDKFEQLLSVEKAAPTPPKTIRREESGQDEYDSPSSIQRGREDANDVVVPNNNANKDKTLDDNANNDVDVVKDNDANDNNDNANNDIELAEDDVNNDIDLEEEDDGNANKDKTPNDVDLVEADDDDNDVASNNDGDVVENRHSIRIRKSRKSKLKRLKKTASNSLIKDNAKTRREKDKTSNNVLTSNDLANNQELLVNDQTDELANNQELLGNDQEANNDLANNQDLLDNNQTDELANQELLVNNQTANNAPANNQENTLPDSPNVLQDTSNVLQDNSNDQASNTLSNPFDATSPAVDNQVQTNTSPEDAPPFIKSVKRNNKKQITKDDIRPPLAKKQKMSTFQSSNFQKIVAAFEDIRSENYLPTPPSQEAEQGQATPSKGADWTRENDKRDTEQVQLFQQGIKVKSSLWESKSLTHDEIAIVRKFFDYGGQNTWSENMEFFFQLQKWTSNFWSENVAAEMTFLICIIVSSLKMTKIFIPEVDIQSLAQKMKSKTSSIDEDDTVANQLLYSIYLAMLIFHNKSQIFNVDLVNFFGTMSLFLFQENFALFWNNFVVQNYKLMLQELNPELILSINFIDKCLNMTMLSRGKHNFPFGVVLYNPMEKLDSEGEKMKNFAKFCEPQLTFFRQAREKDARIRLDAKLTEREAFFFFQAFRSFYQIGKRLSLSQHVIIHKFIDLAVQTKFENFNQDLTKDVAKELETEKIVFFGIGAFLASFQYRKIFVESLNDTTASVADKLKNDKIFQTLGSPTESFYDLFKKKWNNILSTFNLSDDDFLGRGIIFDTLDMIRDPTEQLKLLRLFSTQTVDRDFDKKLKAILYAYAASASSLSVDDEKIARQSIKIFLGNRQKKKRQNSDRFLYSCL